MRKILVVALREYLAAVRTKAFLISLVFLPLLMGTSIGIQVFLQGLEKGKEKEIAVVDRTPGRQLFDALKRASKERASAAWDAALMKQKQAAFTLQPREPAADVHAQRYELSEEVRHGKISGFLDIGPDVLKAALAPPAVTDGTGTAGKAPVPAPPDERTVIRYQSKNPAADPFVQWLPLALYQAILEKRLGIKLSREKLASIAQPWHLEVKGLSERNPRTGEIEDASTASLLAPLLVPPALMTIMFMMVMIGATPLMQGVVEEKTLRIAEVLLGSVRPFPLMTGKLVGMVAVSMTIASVYLGGACWAAYHYGFTDYVPLPLLGWFIVFQAMAVLMYGSLFIAIGAACTDMKETQTLMWPVLLLACIPMFMVQSVIQDPNSPVVMGVSFFPPATPMLMIARQSVPPGIPWWQPVVGILGVLAATIVCVYAAGRIFRVGLLMQGKGARFSDLVKWVFQG